MVDELHTLPIMDAQNLHHTAYVIDAMAMLQALNESTFQTFDGLASIVQQKLLTLLNGPLDIASVTLVFDPYDKADSIKQSE